MVKSYSLTYLLGLLFFLPHLAFSQNVEDITWGSEFTFSNNEIGDAYEVNHRWSRSRQDKYNLSIDSAQNSLIASIKKKCPECTVEQLQKRNGNATSMYRVTYPDAYWIDINPDLGVIETQALPATKKEYERLAERFQNDLFNSANEVGLFPDTFMSGGHIHIGFDFFKNNPILLRNFLVDYTNHFELAEGILDLNQKNAPTLRTFGEEKIRTLKEIIQLFDNNELKFRRKKVSTSLDLAEYYFNFVQKNNRYHALNIQRFKAGDQATIEIRGIRTQANFNEFLQEISLFQARIKYLQELTKQGVRIPVNDYIDESSLGTKKFDRLLVQKFYDYVTESGLNWNKYKKLIYMPELKRKTVIPACGRLFL